MQDGVRAFYCRAALLHVRFGSKADMCSAKRHVRFASKSGHVRCKEGCPLSANSGHRDLFDHLVGARDDRLRNGDAKRLGGLEIDNQLVFGRRLHGQIG